MYSNNAEIIELSFADLSRVPFLPHYDLAFLLEGCSNFDIRVIGQKNHKIYAEHHLSFLVTLKRALGFLLLKNNFKNPEIICKSAEMLVSRERAHTSVEQM